MSGACEYLWLSGLEDLPARTCIVYATNYANKFPARFRDRCETLTSESSAAALEADAQALVDFVWQSEGRTDPPPAPGRLARPGGRPRPTFLSPGGRGPGAATPVGPAATRYHALRPAPRSG